MKYIITEEQNERLEKTIMKFFDKNLTPFEGWESHEDYEGELETNGGELFLRITDDGEWEEEVGDEDGQWEKWEREEAAAALLEEEEWEEDWED